MWSQLNRRNTSRSSKGFGDLSQEEAEEFSFVPSAVSEPQWALHVRANTCREESFKFFQLAAVVTEEGGAARTINSRKQCYNERRLRLGEQAV